MSTAAQVLVVVIALAAFATVLALVRRRRLKERYALIWLLVGAGMVVLVLARPLLDSLSEALGIESGTTTLFLLAILVILGILLQMSISLSELEDKLRDLAEALALHTAASPRGEGIPPVEEPDEGEHEA
jgi:hypothetical protein